MKSIRSRGRSLQEDRLPTVSAAAAVEQAGVGTVPAPAPSPTPTAAGAAVEVTGEGTAVDDRAVVSYVRPVGVPRPFQQIYVLTGFISDTTSADFASDSTYILVAGFDVCVDTYLKLPP